MQQEAPQELVGGHGHQLVPLLVFIVLIGEGDLPVLEFFQPVVGDGDTMGIAAQVIEDSVRAAEWRLGVDHPFPVMERRQIAGETFGIRQFLQFAVELQFPCRVGLLQISEIELPETARQDVHRQEEARTAGHPMAAVQGDSATGHDTVQVGMEIEGLPPRVQDAEKADLRPQMFWICRNRLQGIGSSPKQQIVHGAFVLEGQRGQFRWQGKHDMEILAL